jgi:tryptophan-rich sensory protein
MADARIRRAARFAPDVDAREAALLVSPVVAGGAVGLAISGDIRGWYRSLRKPAWNPPDAVFGPVWTALYLLMGVAAALVARDGRRATGERRTTRDRAVTVGLGAFAVQLALNLAWSLVFFRAHQVRLAFVELCALWVGIALTALAFARVRLVAGLLLVPYLAWTTFAGVLNLEIARRNPRD